MHVYRVYFVGGACVKWTNADMLIFNQKMASQVNTLLLLFLLLNRLLSYFFFVVSS